MTTLNTATAGAPRFKDEPYTSAVAIDVSAADQDLVISCRGIFVGGAGNLALRFVDGTTITLTGCAAGTVYRFCANRIVKTGTTATNLVALI